MDLEHSNKILSDIFNGHLNRCREERERSIKRKLEPWEARCYKCRKIFSREELFTVPFGKKVIHEKKLCKVCIKTYRSGAGHQNEGKYGRFTINPEKKEF